MLYPLKGTVVIPAGFEKSDTDSHGLVPAVAAKALPIRVDPCEPVFQFVFKQYSVTGFNRVKQPTRQLRRLFGSRHTMMRSLTRG